MASRSVNKAILIGHLGRDAETKFTQSGVAMTRFSVATNRRIKDSQTGEWRDETDWVNVVLWRQENISQYLLKGKQVYVEGRIQTRSYEDKDTKKKMYSTEVVADDVILLSGGGAPREEGAMSAPPQARAAGAAKPKAAEGDDSAFDMGITDDDVPF